MENFIARKKAFLEKLEKYTQIAEGIKNSKYNDSEKINLFCDPKNETELWIAEKIFATTIDIMQINNLRSLVEFETIEIKDFSTVPVIDLYRKIMLALKNNNNRYLQAIVETVKEEATPESIAELQFQLISIVSNNEAAFNYLASRTGFNLETDSWQEFVELFAKANDVFNLQIVNGLIFRNRSLQESLQDPATLVFVERQMNKFHELTEKYFYPHQVIKL